MNKLSLAETFTILNIKKSTDDELIKYSFLELLFDNILTLEASNDNKKISKGRNFNSLTNNRIFEYFIKVIQSNGDGESLFYFVRKLKHYLSDIGSFKNILVLPELIDKGLLRSNWLLNLLGFHILTFKGLKLKNSILNQLKQLEQQILQSKETKKVNLSELINSNKSTIFLLTPDSLGYLMEYQKALNKVKAGQDSPFETFMYHANPFDLSYHLQYNMDSFDLIPDLKDIDGFLDSLVDGSLEITKGIGDVILDSISDN